MGINHHGLVVSDGVFGVDVGWDAIAIGHVVFMRCSIYCPLFEGIILDGNSRSAFIDRCQN